MVGYVTNNVNYVILVYDRINYLFTKSKALNPVNLANKKPDNNLVFRIICAVINTTTLIANMISYLSFPMMESPYVTRLNKG